jgi:hypothetical protein
MTAPARPKTAEEWLRACNHGAPTGAACYACLAAFGAQEHARGWAEALEEAAKHIISRFNLGYSGPGQGRHQGDEFDVAAAIRALTHSQPPPEQPEPRGERCPHCGEPLITSCLNAFCSPPEPRGEQERYLPWARAGGPNECEHGYAAGIPCPDCDTIAVAPPPERKP